MKTKSNKKEVKADSPKKGQRIQTAEGWKRSIQKPEEKRKKSA